MDGFSGLCATEMKRNWLDSSDHELWSSSFAFYVLVLPRKE